MERTLAAAAIAAVMLFAPQIASAQTSSQDQRHGSVRSKLKADSNKQASPTSRSFPKHFLSTQQTRMGIQCH